MKNLPVLATALLILSACDKNATEPEPTATPETVVKPARSAKDVCADAEPIAATRVEAKYRMATSSRAYDSGFAFQPRRYSMADLEALANAEQYDELLQHIEDIAPAQRDQAWDTLLASTATALLSKKSGAQGYAAYESFMLAEGLLGRYPKIGNDATFMKERDSAGVAALEACFSNTYRGDECIEAANAFSSHANTSNDAKLELAKVVRRNQNHHVALPFFARSLTDGDTSQVCADEDLQLALQSGLALPTDYDNAKVARDIAAGTCFDVVRPDIEQMLADDPNRYVRDNGCAVLKRAGAL